MSTTNDGGPAFPRPHSSDSADRAYGRCNQELAQPGMSLRDWFAGQALVGLLSDGASAKVAACSAYAAADAMLAQRERPQAPAGPEVAP